MDTRIRLIVEGQGVNETTIDLKELLNVQRELVKATNDLRLATEKKSSDAVKATKEEIGIINSLKSTIATLIKLRNESENTADIQRYNRELKVQQDELTKLTSIQKQQSVLSKEQNAQIQALTANTGQSNSMFKTLLTTMGALFAVDKVLEYSKAMLDNTINTQRLDIALKNISASNADYSASMEFLNKTSDKYGQNVNNLKESYIQFIAASKNSNLSMIERQKIYESVIQAGSTLQLSSEKVERALNAVSQMFSKGNVSAEELRQQLGEHIPGAFGMMAQALGVNEKKLNKMLEQGEVLAKDALPKLGKVLTETYGEKAQSNLETVAGQQNRALNSLTEWLKRKNEDLGVTNKISGAYKYLADNFDSLINVITSLSAVIALNTARKVASNAVDQIKLINLGKEILAKQAASTVTLELTAAEAAAAAAATKFNSALSAAPWGIFLTIGAAALTFLLDYNDKQNKIREEQEKLNHSIAESITPLKQQQIEFNNLSKEVLKGNLSREDQLRLFQKLKEDNPILLKNAKDLQESEKILNKNKIETNSQYDYRLKKFNELKAKFPEQLTGIENLEDAERKLGKVIRDTNTDFILRAKLLENEVKIKYNNELATKAITEQIELENKLRNASTSKGTVSFGGGGLSMGTSSNYAQTESEYESLTKLLNKKKEQVLVYQKANADLASFSEKLNKKLIFNYETETKASNDNLENTKNTNKKAESEHNRYLKALEKDKAENTKAIKKILEEADKDLIDSLHKQYKAGVKNNEDEVKALKKTHEEKLDLIAENMKMTASLELMRKIKTAKTLDEIDRYEKDYAEQIKKIDLGLLQLRLSNKQKEYTELKKLGALTLENEEKYKKEIMELENKIFEFTKKQNEKEVDEKKKNLKEQEDLEKKYLDRKFKATKDGFDLQLVAKKLFNKSAKELSEEEYAQVLLYLDKQKALRKAYNDAVQDSLNFIIDFVFDKYNDQLNEQLDKSNSAIEKAAIKQKIAWNNVGKSALGSLTSLATGNIAGAIVGGVQTIFMALDNLVNASSNRAEARLEDLAQVAKEAGEAFMKYIEESPFFSSDITSQIGTIYKDLLSIDTVVRQDYSMYLDGTQRKLENEVKIGQQIIDNYNKAVDNENKLNSTNLNSINEQYNKSKSNENDLHDTKIKNINDEFNKTIDAINKKYDYEKSKADIALGAATLGIQQQTNQELMALVTNNDTKISLENDYQTRRKNIIDKYATQIKDITPEMTQAEIEGINAAIQARDNLLSGVEEWLTGELTHVLSNEDQKRKAYSKTEEIIIAGQNKINDLKIAHDAAELARTTNKNIEIEKAEFNKNTAIEKETFRFNEAMKVLEFNYNTAIEVETTRHNDILVSLEKTKNDAITESFNIMKDIIIKGHGEIHDSALKALEAGQITIDQFTKIINELIRLRKLVDSDWNLPDLENYDWSKLDFNWNIPRFNEGTELVGGNKGIDKNLALLSHDEAVIKGSLNKERLKAGLNMNKTIEYAVNFKSMLDNPGFMPLQLKSSILPKLEERAAMQYLLNMNMVPVVDELREVKQALSKIPIQNFTLDENGLNKFVKKGNSVQKLRKKRFE